MCLGCPRRFEGLAQRKPQAWPHVLVTLMLVRRPAERTTHLVSTLRTRVYPTPYSAWTKLGTLNPMRARQCTPAPQVQPAHTVMAAVPDARLAPEHAAFKFEIESVDTFDLRTLALPEERGASGACR
jgi:hypothetical protein